ncbi:MAG: polysaccharide pyruvyl transferase family protein [Prevotellaceae bacterium]|jgi:polysaccharide pyruvyl transferase WcaK-like protein|nr:polysaccharide pyruvyl transferase family protein [Prevotellaceae bacterium]
MNNSKKILLSGGWGYGNLGDDAILIASISLIREQFPNAEIIVFSYDTDYTKSIIPDFEVKLSVHREIYGKIAFKQLNTYKKVFNIYLLPNILRRIYFKLFGRGFLDNDTNCEQAFSETQQKISKQCESLFERADIFIMSGGGYFNNWVESFISRCHELRLAKKYNVPAYIMGQTLDKFSSDKIPLAQKMLSSVSGIYLRDSQSFSFLQSMGINSFVGPDLALGFPTYGKALDKNIVFIPAEVPKTSKIILLRSVSDIAKKYSLAVKVCITRLYCADIIDACYFAKNLKKLGVKVIFKIPLDYNDMISDITNSQYLISSNLHGLILGYISGSKILCLNKGWKFEAFMHQCNRDAFLLPLQDVSYKDIHEKIDSLINDTKSNGDKISELSNIVHTSFQLTFI